MNRSFSLLGLVLCVPVLADDTAAPSGVRVLDDDALLHSYNRPAVSPDGRRVAYVSRGHVCVVDVREANPRRVMAVPDSWTGILSRPENLDAYKASYAAGHGIPSKLGRSHRPRVVEVHNLKWTPNGDTLVWATARRDPKSALEVWAATGSDEAKRLTRIEYTAPYGRGMGRNVRPPFAFNETLSHLVFRGRKRPLIWRIADNSPVATPFLNLAPSATSNRWIGFEKDTRQLVITDGGFEVTERFEVFRRRRSFGAELLWSPNERFVLWRNKIGFDHFSNWEGYLLDLETGEKRDLAGQFMREHFAFTGDEGELVRCGTLGKRHPQITASIATAAQLAIYPGVTGEPQRLWRREFDPASRGSGGLLWSSGVFISPDGSRFALAIETPNKPLDFRWRVFDRDGPIGSLPSLGLDHAPHETPCSIAGFAEEGRTLIGYTADCLVAIPVELAD